MIAAAVVKLGGSYAASPELAAWLAAIGRLGGRIVLVPGGGPFADAVRAAQPRLGFDDRAAHRMALLAMEQFAWALASLATALRPVATEEGIRHSLADGSVPVWLPAQMALADPAIRQSWAVTSDSLAAWLAGRIGASRLVLVKQALPAKGNASCRDLARAGYVDEAFPDVLARSGCAAWAIGAGPPSALECLVAGEPPPRSAAFRFPAPGAEAAARHAAAAHA
jgi:dihydroneopterin aldolase